MKKKFTFLMTAMALILAIIGPRSVAWGQTTQTWNYEVVSTSPTLFTGSPATVNGATWSIVMGEIVGSPTTNGVPTKYSNIYGWKWGNSGSNYYKSYTLSTDYFTDKNVKRVTVNFLNNGKKTGTMTVTQGSTTIGTASAEFGTTWTNLTANTTKGSGGTLSINYAVDQASYIHSIIVEYEEGTPSTVAAPTFNPAAGTYYEDKTIELFAEEGCTIHYTLDGSTPDNESTLYEDAIQLTVPSTTTIKAIAVDGEGNSSNVASATYTLKRSQYTPAQLLDEVEPDGQQYTVVFTNEIIKSFYVYNHNNAGFYIETTEGDFLVYKSGTPSNWEVGGKVSGTVTGTWKTYNDLQEFCPENYDDFSYTPPTQPLPTPTNLAASNLSMTGATLSWSAVEHASSYTVYVTGGDDYEETFGPTTNSIVLDDLTAGTTYLWTVKAIGDGTTYLDSEESELAQFNTPTTVLYNINFEAQQTGGTIEIEYEQAAAGEYVYAIATADYHYSFTRWNFSPAVTIYDGEDTDYNIIFIMPDSDVTVSATFTEDTKYTVTYAKGGDDVTGEDPETVSYYENDEVTLEENPYTRTGYTFDEWEVKYADITYYLYENATFEMPASNVTVTATWIEKDPAVITLMDKGAQYGEAINGYVGDNLLATLADVVNPTGLPSMTDYTFAGWAQAKDTENPNIATAETTIAGDITLYAVYAKTTPGTTTWDLVTDASSLAVGDVVVIAASDYDFAMSTTQNTNNRGQAAITKSDNQITWEEDNVQLLTLVSGTKDNTFGLFTGEGYLCAASSSSNYLKTESTLSDNGSWSISISNNVASVVAQGSFTRNVMQYNQSSSLFACYGSASQKALALYKENTTPGTTIYDFEESAKIYTVTYDANGAEGEVPVEARLFAQGDEYTLASAEDLTMAHYTFAGWKANTDEQTYAVGSIYTFGEANVIFTAQWSEDPKYTVFYHANDAVTPEQVYAGELQLTAPENVPNGYTYVGWAEEPIVGVAESATYFSSYNVTRNVDLYAVFAIAEGGGTTSVTKDIIAEAGINASVTLNTNNNPYQMGELPITLTGIKGESNYPALNYNSTNGTDLRFYKGTTCGVTFATTNNSTITKIEFKKNATNASTLGDDFSANVGTLSANVWTGSAESVTISYSADATFKEQMYIINVTYSETSAPTYSNFCTTITALSGNLAEATTEANKAYYISGESTVEGEVIINGVLGNADASLLIIEDGAQLIVNNNGVHATMNKEITGSTASKESDVNWYTISSPLANNVKFADVNNLIPGSVTDTDYDLYRFDEANARWINSRIYGDDETTIIANPDFTTIDKGVGYIYSNMAETTIAFKGEINVDDVECELTNIAAHGFNLIGNPFMQNITLDNVVPDETAVLAEGFYVLNNDETWGTKLTESEIKPLRGFLVQVDGDGGTATISKNVKNNDKRSDEQNANIEIVVSNDNYKDNAYAMFGEGIGLNKVSHRNAEAPMLYIPQDGEDFAIAFMDENVTLFPVSFKAMTTGYYTISLKSSQIYEGYNDFDYLHLIDNMTGEEIDMLMEDGYKFAASPKDNAGRFTVKLHRNGIEENDIENINFVYQNGNELVINGEGALQVFDVLGRVVISEEVHGQRVDVSNLTKGAYIVRLTGESVMTQKIVIK